MADSPARETDVPEGSPTEGPSQKRMSEYEQESWNDLLKFWARKAQPRALPPKVANAVEATKTKAMDAAAGAGNMIRCASPDSLGEIASTMSDWSAERTAGIAVKLLEMVTDAVQELTDPEKVLEYHRKKGRPAEKVSDLRTFDLEELDAFTRMLAWKSRGVGAVDGAAMGAVAMVPVAGTVTAIGLDMLLVHALSTGIATRAAYAYGINPLLESEQHHLDRMLRRAWATQVPKAVATKSARDAFKAGVGRVRWSEKFRTDHRIAAAVEALMKQMGNGQAIPIEKVVSKMPGIGVVTGAGFNAVTLGGMAKESVRYGRTVHLARKYDLALPSNLG